MAIRFAGEDVVEEEDHEDGLLHVDDRAENVRVELLADLTCKFYCGILGAASELGFGNRVIERKPLDIFFP